MIRISLIYLLITVLTGSLILAHKALDLHPSFWALLPVHIEIAIFGWVLQFVLGTAYWIFPRFIRGSARGKKSVGWLMVILLNAGIFFTAIPGLEERAALLGRTALFGAVVLFLILIWGRVVSYRDI